MSNSNPSNNFNSGFEFGLDSRTEGVTDEKANGAPGSLNCSSAQTNYVTQLHYKIQHYLNTLNMTLVTTYSV